MNAPPLTAGARPVEKPAYDAIQKYLQVTRLSNLLTLRSDCFTVYLQVQGWRDVGTPNATLVSNQRAAFIVDRSRVSPANPKFRTPAVYNIPTGN